MIIKFMAFKPQNVQALIISSIREWFQDRDPENTVLRTVLLLLLRIRSAHLEIPGFPIGDAY